MHSLVIGNIAEFNRNNVRGQYTPGEWQMWLRAGDELADMAAFWGGAAKTMLVPAGTNRAWLDALRQRLDWTVELVEPRAATGLLLEDILLDDHALAQLVESFPPGPVDITPWGATPGVLQLEGVLRAAGVECRTQVPAPEALWTVPYLDAKTGLNDLAASVPELTVPATSLATSLVHLLGLVRDRVAAGRPFVAKGNVGVGGFGTFAAPTVSDDVVEALCTAIDDEPIWREGPWLLQDWVPSAPDVLRPTFDGIVHGADLVESVGVGGMLIDGCTYEGVVVGDLPLAGSVVDQVERVGTAVGRAAAALGYRGWYDVDFVLADDGELYATEINARRTSPAHAFDLLSSWSVPGPDVRCVLADDHVPVPAGSSWTTVAPAIDGLDGTGVCCVATIVRTLRGDEPTLGVAIGAPSFADALDARDELRRRLDRRHRRPHRVARRA